MAIRAFVFIECTPGKATQVASATAKLPGVALAHAVTGAYDVIALVEAQDTAALGELVSLRLHRIPHVVKTTTNVVVR
jgi:DNA-binding Lrp family transcriptional regulator